MGHFSLTHIIIVLVIVLIFFGPSKLPQLGQSLGKAIRGFKDGLNELKGEYQELPDKNPDQLSEGNQQAKTMQSDPKAEVQKKSDT